MIQLKNAVTATPSNAITLNVLQVFKLREQAYEMEIKILRDVISQERYKPNDNMLDSLTIVESFREKEDAQVLINIISKEVNDLCREIAYFQKKSQTDDNTIQNLIDYEAHQGQNEQRRSDENLNKINDRLITTEQNFYDFQTDGAEQQYRLYEKLTRIKEILSDIPESNSTSDSNSGKSNSENDNLDRIQNKSDTCFSNAWNLKPVHSISCNSRNPSTSTTVDIESNTIFKIVDEINFLIKKQLAHLASRLITEQNKVANREDDIKYLVLHLREYVVNSYTQSLTNATLQVELVADTFRQHLSNISGVHQDMTVQCNQERRDNIKG